MRIGVNALYLIPGRVGGTEIYLRSLLTALAEIDHHNHYFIFTNRETGTDLVPEQANFTWVPQAVHAARAVLRAGADWLKLATTGGVTSPTDDPELPELTFEEIHVAVEEASRKRRPVMVHANGGLGLDDAVRAGVRSVEHGVLLTEEQAAAMARAGCWLVPTLAIGHEVVEMARAGTLPAVSAAKALALEPRLGECVRIAKDHGVPMALGSDFLTRAQHGRNLVEIDHMHRAGLTVEEALLAATWGGQRLCGRELTHGRIAPGYAFDAILLEREPADTAIFRDPAVVSVVFKAGRLVRCDAEGLTSTVALTRAAPKRSCLTMYRVMPFTGCRLRADLPGCSNSHYTEA